MDKVVLSKRIILESKYLTHDIDNYICDKLIKNTQNECSKEYGHIVEVIKILNIEGHEIGRVNFDNIFNVKFEAFVLNPTPNSEFECEVCLLYKDGIFVNIMERQKMLIPRKELNNYDYDETNMKYVNEEEEIVIGSKLKVKVTASQYRKKNFSCFGKLVQKLT